MILRRCLMYLKKDILMAVLQNIYIKIIYIQMITIILKGIMMIVGRIFR